MRSLKVDINEESILAEAARQNLMQPPHFLRDMQRRLAFETAGAASTPHDHLARHPLQIGVIQRMLEVASLLPIQVLLPDVGAGSD